MLSPPHAEVVLMRTVLVSRQYTTEITEEVVKVVIPHFGLNVEISVPTIFPGCSFDAIGLKIGGDVVRMVRHLVTFREVDPCRKSVVPRIVKVVHTYYGKDDIAGDDDLVTVPNAIVVRPLLVAK
jgi:hypothetical protein